MGCGIDPSWWPFQLNYRTSNAGKKTQRFVLIYVVFCFPQEPRRRVASPLARIQGRHCRQGQPSAPTLTLVTLPLSATWSLWLPWRHFRSLRSASIRLCSISSDLRVVYINYFCWRFCTFRFLHELWISDILHE